MLKSLVLLSSSLGVLSAPIVQTRSNVVREDGMEITYKYQSNEVNSNDDLIIENVYTLKTGNNIIEDFLDNNDETIVFKLLSDLSIDNSYINVDDYTIDFSTFTKDLILMFQFTNDTPYIYVYYSFEQYSNRDYTITYTYENFFVNDCNIQLLDFNDTNSNIKNYLTYTTYNEIESVERYYPSNIFGNVSQFIDDNILNGIPNIDNVSYSIGGQNITLRSWLNTSICVVLACCLIGLLIWFVRYLFRLFSGLLH